MRGTANLRVDVHVGERDLDDALRQDATTGLRSDPKFLPPKWFYDDRGSTLFEQIMGLPEYYPTRREREILRRQAREVAERIPADTLVELGSGNSEKTRWLLDSLDGAGSLQRYVPFDISAPALRSAAADVAADYPHIAVHGIVGDFERHLACIPSGRRRLVAFLGGTIGNFPPRERGAFLSRLAAHLHPGDALLLGADLVKDRARLEAAYNDSAGVTAQFNLNVLHVLNARLGADFDAGAFEHRAFFDVENEWIEMRLRSKRAQSVTLDALSLRVSFAPGEEMRTEISAKFRRERLVRELERARLCLDAWWTDRQGDYSLSLWTVR